MNLLSLPLVLVISSLSDCSHSESTRKDSRNSIVTADSTAAQTDSARNEYINRIALRYLPFTELPSYGSGKIASVRRVQDSVVAADQDSFFVSEVRRTAKKKLLHADTNTLERMARQGYYVEKHRLDSAGKAYDSVLREIGLSYNKQDIKRLSEQGYNIFDLFMDRFPSNLTTEAHLLKSRLVLIGHIK